MMDWLADIEPHWIWLTFGVLLAGFEMLLPGYYMIWLALAAIITGVLAGLTGMGPAVQVVSFVVLALITVYSARRFLSDNPIASADPLLNRRGARMVGQTAQVVQPIAHGSGRVRVGDGEWNAKGADVAAGEWVRITGCEGVTLVVEPLALLPGQPSAEA
jgi:membrane protein implicated in regulation of membrane protease activity